VVVTLAVGGRRRAGIIYDRASFWPTYHRRGKPVGRKKPRSNAGMSEQKAEAGLSAFRKARL